MLNLYINFSQLSKFKINWIVFAGTFTSALNKPSNLRKVWILSTNQSNVKMNKKTEYWPIRLQPIITAFKRQRAIVARWVLLRFDDGRITDFSLHLFDASDFKVESSPRFSEMVATDLLEMRDNNQNKNTQRSRKTNGLVQFGCPQNFSHPIISKLDSM